MRTTRQLSITLPNEMADQSHQKVASGDCASDARRSSSARGQAASFAPAVIVQSEQAGVGLIRGCPSLGFQVPDDISVLSIGSPLVDLTL